MNFTTWFGRSTSIYFFYFFGFSWWQKANRHFDILRMNRAERIKTELNEKYRSNDELMQNKSHLSHANRFTWVCSLWTAENPTARRQCWLQPSRWMENCFQFDAFDFHLSLGCLTDAFLAFDSPMIQYEIPMAEGNCNERKKTFNWNVSMMRLLGKSSNWGHTNTLWCKCKRTKLFIHSNSAVFSTKWKFTIFLWNSRNENEKLSTVDNDDEFASVVFCSMHSTRVDISKNQRFNAICVNDDRPWRWIACALIVWIDWNEFFFCFVFVFFFLFFAGSVSVLYRLSLGALVLHYFFCSDISLFLRCHRMRFKCRIQNEKSEKKKEIWWNGENSFCASAACACTRSYRHIHLYLFKWPLSIHECNGKRWAKEGETNTIFWCIESCLKRAIANRNEKTENACANKTRDKTKSKSVDFSFSCAFRENLFAKRKLKWHSFLHRLVKAISK